MIKAKAWSGDDLRGTWEVTLKVDGVRALSNGRRVVSRRGKPLHNLERHVESFTDAEIWLGSFKDTISAVRTKHTGGQGVDPVILRQHIYSLDPMDPRLRLGSLVNPTAAAIRHALAKFKRKGCDGLILRQNATWLKVKHVETYDVRVQTLVVGVGKHAGRLGSVLTSKGAVGTGFSDAERTRFWRDKTLLRGKIIEVSCLSLTADGKFRHARFVRIREDK